MKPDFIDDDGREVISGLTIHRNGAEQYGTKMDRITWDRCPDLGNIGGPGLVVRAGLDLSTLVNMHYQWCIGVNYGVDLGKAEKAAEIRKVLGLSTENDKSTTQNHGNKSP